ncbi:MAG: hypothetical protein V3T31_05615 [candidate division Zixibacteria bacterium]
MQFSRRLIIRFLIIVAVSSLALSGSVQAQDVAVGSATATVLTALAVSSSAALAFGNVYQGVPTAIANNNASAGVFALTGSGLSGISIFMMLPDYLSLSDNTDRMTITFGTTDCSVDSTGAGNPATMGASKGWQNVNPRSIPSTTAIGGLGTTNIYLGGKVYPSIGQKSGSYSADVVVTVAYDGT